MPIYTFKDESGKVDDYLLSLSELDAFKAAHPELKRVITAAAIGDSVRMGMTKPAAGFRDLLKHIHNRAGGNHRYHHN